MSRKAVIILVLLLGLVAAAAAEAPAPGYTEVVTKEGLTKIELNNGLSVVLVENHAAPVVALQVWVKVGSRNEEEGQAGISHVFEHMLFKGTAKRGVGDVAREIESAGGNINAFTSFDHTVYHVALASRYLDVGLDILADAIQNSSFDPEELTRESEVVLEELKRAQDNPDRVAGLKLFETAYEVHPYRRPIIGYEETFTALERKHYLDYLDTWYVPNNMSVIVVGDFDTAAVIPKVVQAFRNFVADRNISLELPAEPEQQEHRAVVTRMDASRAILKMGYHIPGIRDPQNPAWDLLGMILGQGETSRLYREVKRKEELVHTIGSYAYTPMDPGMLVINAQLDPPKIEEALKAILYQVHRLGAEPVDAEELYRARVNVESDFIYSKQTMQGQARRLGYYESDFGDPLQEENYLKGIGSVSPGEIMELARTYLRPENLTVSLLVAPDVRTDLDAEGLKKRVRKIANKVAKEFPVQKAGAGEQPRKIVLSNGIRLIVKENHALPVVSVKVAFLGGQRFEKEETSGLYHFVASMLDRGTAKRSAEEISAEIENMGGSVSGFSGRNSFGAELAILSRHFLSGMGLLSDVVLYPSFDAGEVEKVRKDILAAIQRQNDVLFRRAGNLFRKTLYQVHPYRLRLIGEEETVQGFTAEQMRRVYGELISPDRMVIAVAGDITEEQAVAAVEELFGGMEKNRVVDPAIPEETRQDAIREQVEFADRQQAHMILGVLGTTVRSEDRYVLEVLNNVLAGQGGRLFAELRDRQSLAYAVTSFSQEGVDPGFFAAYIGCSPEKLEEARAGILREFRRIREEPVSEEEMARSRRNLIGGFEIGLQTNGALASAMVFDELYGNGYKTYQEYSRRIGKVTAADVQRVAREYIDLDRYSLAVVTSPEGNEQVQPGRTTP